MSNMERIENNFLGNKPMELAHALFRVARNMRHEGLRSRIEAWSITFLESASLCHIESMSKDIHILEQLVILGEAVGEVPYQNSKILYAQFGMTKSAIQQQESMLVANSAIDAIFSHQISASELPINEYLKKQGIGHVGQTLNNNTGNTETRPFIIGISDDGSRALTSGSSDERRKMIVERIRQLGSAAMKDLVAAFPLVSERTIRYDLQKLCELMVLERSGNGGPASYYHIHGVLARESSLA